MELFQKLLKVQAKLKAPKNQYNDFGKYSYRSCEDIVEAVKPLLAEEGLVMTISDDLVLIGDRHYIKATVTVTDSENSHKVNGFAREAEKKKGMDESQITGAASSYARKYALNGMFAIDDCKDSDATNKHDKTNNGKQKASSNSKKKKTKSSPQGIASKKQLKYMHTLRNQIGVSEEALRNAIRAYDKESSKELTTKEASEIIDWLLKEKEKREAQEA